MLDISEKNSEILALKELINSLNKKNDQLIQFKMLTDQKLLNFRRHELEYSNAVDQLKEQATLINVQFNTERRRKEDLNTQLTSFREAMHMFLNSSDDISEVLNFLANDLLL